MIRTLLEAFLETLGCGATICDDGALAADGLARAAREGTPVNMILVDLRLGEVSGFEWCRRLRAAGVDTSIVCMSGDIGSTDAQEYTDAGFDGALAKPLSLADLEACIARHAWRRHLPAS